MLPESDHSCVQRGGPARDGPAAPDGRRPRPKAPRSSSWTTGARTAPPTSPGRCAQTGRSIRSSHCRRTRGRVPPSGSGWRTPRGDAIGYVDADMGTDPKDLKLLLGALGRSHVAVGSRAHELSVVKRDIHRRVMNRTFGMAVASMTRLPYMDTQCGFKAFRGPIAKLLWHGARIDRFAFDVEVLDLAVRFGLLMEEVPVNWVDVSGSKVRPIHDGLQMLSDVARSRLIPKPVPPVQGVVHAGRPHRGRAVADPAVRAQCRSRDRRGTGERLSCFPGVPPTVGPPGQGQADGRSGGVRSGGAERGVPVPVRSLLRGELFARGSWPYEWG